MSTPDEIEPPSEWKPARDIPGWGLALGLAVLLVVFMLVRGFPRLTSVEGVIQVLAFDIGMLAAPVVLGWAIVLIPEAIARRRGRPRTALRRNTLIAGWMLTALMVFGMQTDRAGTDQTTQTEDNNSPTVPMTAPAPSAPAVQSARSIASQESVQPDPVPIEKPAPTISAQGRAGTGPTPAPWTVIATESEYVQASTGERKAIRDLYWRICAQHLIPREERQSAYELFLRDWEIGEADVPPAPSRRTSVAQYLHEQQYGVPSPVDASTMHRWCEK